MDPIKITLTESQLKELAPVIDKIKNVISEGNDGVVGIAQLLVPDNFNKLSEPEITVGVLTGLEAFETTEAVNEAIRGETRKTIKNGKL